MTLYQIFRHQRNHEQGDNVRKYLNKQFNMTTYYTFKRSARNFEEFSSAEKIIQSEGLSIEEARNECKDFNNNRTSEEIEQGTKLEFESED